MAIQFHRLTEGEGHVAAEVANACGLLSHLSLAAIEADFEKTLADVSTFHVQLIKHVEIGYQPVLWKYVGILAYHEVEKDNLLYLTQFGILPRDRRQGLGPAAFKAFVKAHPQFDFVYLHTRVDNEEGLRFWRDGIGVIPISGEQTGKELFGEDSVLPEERYLGFLYPVSQASDKDIEGLRPGAGGAPVC